MPKYHKVVVGTNPIDPREVKRRIVESSRLPEEAVTAQKKGQRVYVTLDTGDGLPKSFRQILALLPEEYLDEILEEIQDVRIQGVGPINLDDVDSPGSGQSAE